MRYPILIALAVSQLVASAALAGLSPEKTVFCKITGFDTNKVTAACDGERTLIVPKDRVPAGTEMKEAAFLPVTLSAKEYKKYATGKKLILGSVKGNSK